MLLEDRGETGLHFLHKQVQSGLSSSCGGEVMLELDDSGMSELGKDTEFTISVLRMLDNFFKSELQLVLGIDCLNQYRSTR